MKFNPATFKSVLFACALIGACQSVIWIFLCVCAILAFRCVLRTPQYGTDHFIVTTIVKFYFEGDECKVEGGPPGYPDISEAKLTKPIVVFSWMIAFLVISSIQLLYSLFLIKRRSGETIRSVLRDWCFATSVVAIMDVVLTGTFVIDYIALRDYLEINWSDEEGIVAAPAAMFTIAARGFALWIVNAAFVVYFSLWISSTSSLKTASDGKRGERGAVKARGYDNGAFTTSSDSLVGRNGERSDLASYDATQEIAFYPVTQQRRPPSVSSFEAVTRFNEEKHPETAAKTQLERNKERGRFECNCHIWANEPEGTFQTQWRRNVFHSHGCPMLRSELEQKLATVRGSQETFVNRAKKLTDFSHDIRNFKPGGGEGKAKTKPRRGQIPEAIPKPAAVTCNNSSFY